MSLSIRKERESIDPEKNADWKKSYINEIYNACKAHIGKVIPNYNVEIIEVDNKFSGYNFSKKFTNDESSGKLHFSIRIVSERYLIISLYAEGEYTDNKDRIANKFTRNIFSIEQDLHKKMYDPNWSDIDVSTKIRQCSNSMEKYIS